MRQDYLLNKKVKIYQPEGLYHASTDAVWLAAAVEKVKKGDSILDVGSGTGAVSLCLAARFRDKTPQIIGIDIQKDLVEASNLSVVKYKKLPQYPEVQRDLSFVVPVDTTYDSIKKIVKKAVKSNLYKGCEIFDVYQGEHMEEGFKSLAFRVKLQDENATLTDEVVESQIQSVKSALEKSGINLRG